MSSETTTHGGNAGRTVIGFWYFGMMTFIPMMAGNAAHLAYAALFFFVLSYAAAQATAAWEAGAKKKTSAGIAAVFARANMKMLMQAAAIIGTAFAAGAYAESVRGDGIGVYAAWILLHYTIHFTTCKKLLTHWLTPGKQRQ